MLIAISLLPTGCRSVMPTGRQRIFDARVCPVCDARSVAECHCFQATATAGYSETSWTSLDPWWGTAADEVLMSAPTEEFEIEELPQPQAAPAAARHSRRTVQRDLEVTSASYNARPKRSTAAATVTESPGYRVAESRLKYDYFSPE